MLLKRNGGGTTVAGWGFAIVTAVAVGILLRRRVSIHLMTYLHESLSILRYQTLTRVCGNLTVPSVTKL